MTKFDIAELVTERNAALLSLDYDTIVAYCRKYGVPVSSNPEVFWAGVHKARLSLTNIPEEAKAISRAWLITHGFKAVGL